MTSADDFVAIQNLKARYCAAVDALAQDSAKSALVFRDIFLPEVVGDYGFDPMIGADALVDFLCNVIAGNSEWRLHMIHTPLIVVNGDQATGDWTLTVHLQRPGGSIDVLLGRYSDAFKRMPDGWRIARMRFLRQT